MNRLFTTSETTLLTSSLWLETYLSERKPEVVSG